MTVGGVHFLFSLLYNGRLNLYNMFLCEEKTSETEKIFTLLAQFQQARGTPVMCRPAVLIICCLRLNFDDEGALSHISKRFSSTNDQKPNTLKKVAVIPPEGL